MDVCSQCGARHPGRQPCAICGGPGAVSAPEPTERLSLVGISSQFQCRSCGQLAPINHLHLTRSILCLCCGQQQVFDPTLWAEGLNMAHAVGDLAGPEPEGRSRHARIAIDAINPYRKGIVQEYTLNEQSIVGGLHEHRSLFLKIFPGHPLCEQCLKPLRVEQRPGQTLETRCSGCRQSGTYRAPDTRLLRLARPDALRGVISSAERQDRPEVRIVEGSTTAGITCSGCGAPLSLDGGEELITCRFCTLVSRIPDRLRAGHVTDPTPAVWWVAFSGPSQTRQDLLSGAQAQALDEPVRDETPGAAIKTRRLLAGLAFPGAALAIVAAFAAAMRFWG